jgi:hypothetical protein
MDLNRMDRRQFIWGNSLAALSTMARFDSVMAREAKYVIAETTFGKIRGIENRGINMY